jgi:hypothetical protein
MQIDTLDSATFRGDLLKQKVLSRLTDGELVRSCQRQGTKYLVPGTDRVNLFKARSDLSERALATCHASDPGVRDVILKWLGMSGLTPADAVFWQEPGFLAAIRAGSDIHLRRYLDDDGWAWLVVRDQPSCWSSKKRLPELTRKWMKEQLERRTSLR